MLTSIQKLFHATPIIVDASHVTRNPLFWARYQHNALRNAKINDPKANNIGARSVLIIFPDGRYALGGALSTSAGSGVFFVAPFAIASSLYTLQVAGKGPFDTLKKSARLFSH